MAESELIAWRYMSEQIDDREDDRTNRSLKIMAPLHLSTYLLITYQ